MERYLKSWIDITPPPPQIIHVALKLIKSYHLYKMKLNEMNGSWGHICAHHRLNWARKTSRGWWDESDGTALQTQDSKFETSRARGLPRILNLYEWAGQKPFVSLKLEGRSGVWTRDLRPPHQSPRPASLHSAVNGRKVCEMKTSRFRLGKTVRLKLAEVCLMQGLYY